MKVICKFCGYDGRLKGYKTGATKYGFNIGTLESEYLFTCPECKQLITEWLHKKLVWHDQPSYIIEDTFWNNVDCVQWKTNEKGVSDVRLLDM